MASSATAEFSKPRWQDRFGSYRNVLAIVTALTLLQGAAAALSVMIALSLQASGTSNAALGLVAAFYAGGFLLGAILSPAQIARIGHIRSFSFFAAIAVIASLSFTLGVNVIGWALVQAIIGASSAALYTAGESWIADSAPSGGRGSILGFYHVVSKLGAIAGPFAVMAGASGLTGFILVAVLFALTILPITATKQAQPMITTGPPFGPSKILRYAPAAAFAAFAAGAVNNAVAQLYPVFAQSVSPESPASFTANFNAALLIGAMAGLWPAGFISDRIDRRIVISVCGAVGGGSAILLALFAAILPKPVIIVLAFTFGSGALSYYAVAVAHAADKAQSDQATSMMAGILVIWGIGSIVGPLIAGLIMTTPLGASGLFAFAGISLACLAIAMLTRAVNTDAVDQQEKEPFNATQATSLALSEIDPRGEETGDQFDLFEDWRAETGTSQ